MKTLEHDIRPPADAISGVIRDLYAAMIAADVMALRGLLAPGFTLTHITGVVQSREVWLEEIANGRMRYHEAQEHAIDVDVHRVPVRVVARHVVDATIWGGRHVWPLQLTGPCVATADGWQLDSLRATLWR